MKTAMQQLIERLEEEDINVPFLIKSVYLEKEKQQIIEAYGRSICMFYESEQPEEYYNETYNQDKELPKDVKDMLDNL
jgi:hypothetical protein